MDMRQRPYRSVLYIPGSKPRALDKARNLPVDAIIFDLEDAVSLEEKETARDTLKEALLEGGYGDRFKIVRINGFDTDWGEADAKAVTQMGAHAVLLPKVSSPADLDALAKITGDLPIWAMMESPLSILNAQEIASASKRMKGMVLGSNDLIKDLYAKHTQDREALWASMGHCLLAARAYGLVCIDGVHNAFRDQDGLRISCMQGRNLGFDGKTLIHPDQLDVANDIYRPSKGEIDLAKRQMAAFEEAEASGKGIAVLDGQIVENLHIVSARALLAKADAIAASAT